MSYVQQLLGSWSLITWEIEYSDGRPSSYPYGKNPQGSILYAEGGWMSAAINIVDRSELDTSIALRRQPQSALAEAYKSYFHYAGSYEVRGDTVFHSVKQSLNPNFVGTIQERQIVFSADKLTLSGVDSVGDLKRHHNLHWQRL